MTILDPKKLQAMEAFMRDMSTVLVRRKVAVKMDTQTQEYAYTSGDRITINPTHSDWTAPIRAWLETKGFFYHEVMHLIADPMENYEALPYADRHYANMLGDQAGEVRMASLYPGAKPYFAMNVYKFLLQKLEPRTYSLVYGRRTFLPRRLIATSRKLMLKDFSESDVKEMERIVDEYTKLTGTEKSFAVFAALVKQFRELLTKNNPMPPQGLPERVRGGKMSPEARKVDVSAPPVSSEPEPESKEDEASDEDKGEEEKQTGSGSKNSEPSKQKAEEGSEGSGAGAGESEDDEAEETRQRQECRRRRRGREQSAELRREMAKEIKDQLQDLIDDESQTASKEALEMGLMGGVAESNTVSAAHEMAALLRKVQQLAKSAYDGGKRAGRLNLRAVRQGRGLSTEIFQQWQPDRRMANKVSVVVCVDKSGSMSSTIHDVNQIAAAIAMACEEASPYLNRIMIRYFSDRDSLAKRPEEKFDPKKHLWDEANGGTNPFSSMWASLAWLRGEQGTKLLIIVTDSQWSSYSDMHGVNGFLAQMYAAKVQTQVYAVNGSAYAPHGLPTKAVTMETLAEDVFELVQSAVREQARRSLA